MGFNSTPLQVEGCYSFGNIPALCIQEYTFNFQRGIGFFQISYINSKLEDPIVIGLIQPSFSKKVTDVGFRSCQQIDIPLYPGQAPEILVFKIAAIRKLKNLNGYFITTILQIRCNIKFRGKLGILAVAYFVIVDPDIVSGFNRPQVNKYFPIVPVIRQGEEGDVGAHRTILVIDVGRIFLKRVLNVVVLRKSVAVQFPVGRYGYRFPPSYIVS